ncbi:MAG: tetratricopeptide repeat protein, partial [Reichenbachiella sp.]
MNKSSLLLLCILLTSLVSFGQGKANILDQGNEQFDNLQYQKAIDSYTKAYDQTKSDEALRGLIRSHLELGIQYQFNGDATKSQNNFSQGLALAETLVAGNASNDENRLLRGLLYIYNSQFENARTDYEYVKLLYPDNGRVYYYLWVLEPAEGLSKIEHPYVKEALTLDPNLFELHQELGSYYSGLGMADQAITSFEKAIAISPKNYKANFSLGKVYWGMGDLEKMRHHFSESIKYFPDFGYGQMMLGGVELMSGNTTEAVSLIKVALKNNPAAEAYLPMYKENFPVLDNYNFKIKEVENENPVDKDGFPRYYQEALSLAQAHDYYAARDLFHQSLDAYQDYPQKQPAWTISILSWLSHCNRELGYYADAIHSTREALALSIQHNITTDQASLAANIGAIYYAWGDYPNAIKYGKQSLNYLIKYNQDEQVFDAYINLGVQYRKWEKYDSAIYYHQLALERSKDQDLDKQAMAYQEMALSYNANSQLKLAQENIKLMFKAAKSQGSGNQDAMYNLSAAKVNYKMG